jgi:hypothetical protein
VVELAFRVLWRSKGDIVVPGPTLPITRIRSWRFPLPVVLSGRDRLARARIGLQHRGKARLGDRKREMEYRPVSQLAGDSNLAAVSFHDRFGDR